MGLEFAVPPGPPEKMSHYAFRRRFGVQAFERVLATHGRDLRGDVYT